MISALLWLLGPILGMALQEMGGWGQRWSEKLIRSRSRSLARGQRSAWVDASLARVDDVPGQWSKLIYTAVKLRPDKVISDQALFRRTRQLILAGSAGISALCGFALAKIAITVLGLPTLAAAPVALLMAVLIFSVDRTVAFVDLPQRLWRKGLALVPRVVIAASLSLVMTSALTLLLLQDDLDAALKYSGHDGLAARLKVMSQLVDAHPDLRLMQAFIFATLLLSTLLPMLMPALMPGGARLRSDGRPRHAGGRKQGPD